MPEIVIATGNPHKVEELRAILASDARGSAIRVLGLNDLGGTFEEPAETGRTFKENAGIKASSYAQQTGRLCLADDSGLEIDALEGRPGVISSHYCTGGREVGMSREERDRANNLRVLAELGGTPSSQRGARFVCVMALADSKGLIHQSRGTFEGRIGVAPDVPRGSNGFGYDPLFLVAPEYRVTSAELTSEQKNGVSHRGVAAHAMAAWLCENGGKLGR